MRRPSLRTGNARQAGFSLVELAVVVGVLGVLAMTALSAFDNIGHTRQHNAARAHAQAARQALHAFVLRNKRLPCPDNSSNGDSGREAGGSSCAANSRSGWLPYESLGLDLPVRGERLRYGVHRGSADTDLVAPRMESADQPDVEGFAGFSAALARVASAPSSTSQPYYLSNGSPDCGVAGPGTNLINPAFVLVAAVTDRDGLQPASNFDGPANRAFVSAGGMCVTPPDYPGDARYDDVVLAESATTLLGWLMTTTR